MLSGFRVWKAPPRSWTTNRSIESSFRVICSKNLRIRSCTVDDNLSLMFIEFGSLLRIETLVRCAVHGILSKRLQHHISNASILRQSCILDVHASAPDKKIGKTMHFISRTFVFLVILRSLQTFVSFFTEDLAMAQRLRISSSQLPAFEILEPRYM
ncbi:hypothetical protein WA026_018948 [Henosepilachna vigintioctopunctata]|uniref:Uncharacterized protein n=1 Tax=Henosepilachna vigintioctopunctata TaxID=420089 RepID=A0AAW1ULZ8_9CUCU